MDVKVNLPVTMPLPLVIDIFNHLLKCCYLEQFKHYLRAQDLNITGIEKFEQILFLLNLRWYKNIKTKKPTRISSLFVEMDYFKIIGNRLKIRGTQKVERDFNMFEVHLFK